MKTRTFIPILIFAALAACVPAINTAEVPPTATAFMPLATQTQTGSREAQVQSMEIQIKNNNPVQVNAVVRGNLTESCATLGQSQVQYASNAFRITFYVVHPADMNCAQIITPFETTIPLNTKDLPPGDYTFIANGVSAVFTLPVETATPSPIPTIAPIPTSTIAPVNTTCTDAAKFVADVTIPDNMVIAPNTAFTKTWRLKNTGTCTWDSNYLVAYISGTTMSQQPGYWILQPGQTVAPSQTADISVGMTSPVENGYYASYWGLKNANGQFIPIQGGANGNSFYVKIKVGAGSMGGGNVTAASIDIGLEQGSGAVCTPDATYLVHAYITADGPATASYEIGSTAGQIPAGNFQNNNGTAPFVTGTVVFDQAGTKTINLRFVGPYPYPGDITVNIRVDSEDWHNTRLSCQ